MKQLRFFPFALILMLGLFMTSCVDSDNSTTSTQSAIAKFKSYAGIYYFETADGFKIYPTTSSMSSLTSSSSSTSLSSLLGNVVQFWYSYDSETAVITETTMENVDALAIMDMNDPVEYVDVEGADNDSIENTPVIDLGNSTYAPTRFDDTTIVLPINHYVNKTYHYFTLVYYPEETEGTTITLHLRHNKGGDAATTASNTAYTLCSNGYAYIDLYLHAFDLSEIIASLDVTPTTAKIVYKQSGTSMDLDDAVENTYTLSLTSSN